MTPAAQQLRVITKHLSILYEASASLVGLGVLTLCSPQQFCLKPIASDFRTRYERSF